MKHTVSQRRAINSDAPEIVCIAGPGSGKTSTTIARITRLVESGVDPEKIVALTFTNAGADELTSRLVGTTQHTVEDRVRDFRHLGYTGTLHGFALKMLKQYGGPIGYGERIAIIGEEASADLLASKAQTLGCKLRLDDLLRLKGKPTPTGRLDLPQLVLKGYHDDLHEAGMVDFDTILTEFLRLVETGAPLSLCFDHLFVDEAPDSAEIDWAIYEAVRIKNKFYCGDPDQAVYSFRGGRGDLLINKAKALEGKKDAVILLQENFRSHLEICQASDRLIGHNRGRIPKHSISVLGEGGEIRQMHAAMNEGEEIAGVAGGIKTFLESMHTPAKEIAVLARTNAICHAYRTTLKACGIPVVEPAKSSFPYDWGLAKALIELLVNPQNDTLAFFYLLARKLQAKVPVGTARKEVQSMFLEARRKGDTVNDRFLYFPWQAMLPDVGPILASEKICAETQRLIAGKVRRLGPQADLLQLALAMALPETEPAEATEGVTVTTIHGAKGKEFDVVFLVGFEDEIIPGRAASMTAAKRSKFISGGQAIMDRIEEFPADPVEEERRLAFVAVSRARKAVYIAHAESRVTPWGKIEGHTPSRFIKEMLP